MKRFFLWLVVAGLTLTANAQKLVSPNGKLSVTAKNGQFAISYQGQQVLQIKAAEAATSLKGQKAKKVKADYQMLAGKRSQ